MRISIIAAVGKNREIGQEGHLPWKLPDDLRMFQALTTNHTVIMGRLTHKSIGSVLPERTNIVITSHPLPEDGLLPASNLETALELVPKKETEVFIIGGQRVYQEALPRADRLYLTSVEGSFPLADTFFPEFDLHDWELKASTLHPQDERHSHPYAFRVFDRKRSKE